jgi:putative transposase
MNARERIKCKMYDTRKEGRRDKFDYIEIFYNAKRGHSFNNLLSPVENENWFELRLESV